MSSSHHIDCTNAQCHEDCPAGILDKQSGILKSGAIKSTYIAKESENNHMSGKNYEHSMMNRNSSTGGASRFFYCAKASKREKNKGCENIEKRLQANANFRPNHLEAALSGDTGKPHGRYSPTHNIHPTVKPIAVIKWLVQLITPPQGTCLDLFAGSGTTGIACELAGVGYVLIDMEPDYVEITKARIAAWRLNPELEEPEDDETEKDQTTPKQKSPQLGLF